MNKRLKQLEAKMRVLATILLSAVLWSASSNSEAHDIYGKWVNPETKIGCCNNRDCKPVEWRLAQNGDLELLISPGIWITPPSNSEVKDQIDHEGRAHWCGYIGRKGEVNTFCFLSPKPQT